MIFLSIKMTVEENLNTTYLDMMSDKLSYNIKKYHCIRIYISDYLI